MPEMQLLQSTLKHSWYNYVLTLLTGKGRWGWHWKWSSFKLRQATHQCMIELCPFTIQNLLISVKVSCTTLCSTPLWASLITREVREWFQGNMTGYFVEYRISSTYVVTLTYRSPDPFTLYAITSSVCLTLMVATLWILSQAFTLEHSCGISVGLSASFKVGLPFNQSGPYRYKQLNCNSDIVIPLAGR